MFCRHPHGKKFRAGIRWLRAYLHKLTRPNVSTIPRAREYDVWVLDGPVVNSHILVVTPVFNDWGSFSRLLDELAKVGSASGLVFTVLAVDDGSSQLPPEPNSMHLGGGIREV